jgi:hypothetical protein
MIMHPAVGVGIRIYFSLMKTGAQEVERQIALY